MTEKIEIHKCAGGEIAVWKEPQGAINLQVLNRFHDPVDMGEDEALELGELLIRLANEERST
jgi:hypothetical protein